MPPKAGRQTLAPSGLCYFSDLFRLRTVRLFAQLVFLNHNIAHWFEAIGLFPLGFVNLLQASCVMGVSIGDHYRALSGMRVARAMLQHVSVCFEGILLCCFEGTQKGTEARFGARNLRLTDVRPCSIAWMWRVTAASPDATSLSSMTGHGRVKKA